MGFQLPGEWEKRRLGHRRREIRRKKRWVPSNDQMAGKPPQPVAEAGRVTDGLPRRLSLSAD